MKLPGFQPGRGPAAGTVHGAAHDPPFNLDRTKIRLDGLGGYASVSALLLNAALRLFSSTPKTLDQRKWENAVKIFFVALVSATVIFGTYTTMVFSLLSLYSKTALGMGLDKEYVEFFKSTAEIRKSGFLSFVGCVLAFNLSYVVSLYLTYEGSIRYYITSISAVVMAVCIQNWFLIVQYASVMFEDASSRYR